MVNTPTAEDSVTITPDLAGIETALSESYGLRPVAARRVPVGQGTVNFMVECRERTVFVKQFAHGTDWAAEETAIELSVAAGRVGVPVADVVTSTRGELLHRRGDLGISVWAYVEGSGDGGPINAPRMAETGAALGRIHRSFADHPASHGPAPETTTWYDIDLDRLRERIHDLLARIAQRPEPDDFDLRAGQTLTERLSDIERIPELLAGLPPLTSQVLHGDFSAVNLIFQDDTLAAVVDFRPPNPFLVSYELGRIAFDVSNVVLSDDWLPRATALAEAYLTEHPGVVPSDVVYSARVWLVHLLRSLYGVRNHYLAPGLLQDALDEFWLLRHRAAHTLLSYLSEIEEALSEAVSD